MSADEAPEPGILSVANLRDTEWYEGNDDSSCDSDSWSVISFESAGARCTKINTDSDESCGPRGKTLLKNMVWAIMAAKPY